MSDLSFLNQIPDPLPPAEVSARSGDERLGTPRAAAPTRRVAQRRRLAALGVSLAWLCAHLAVYGIRQDFARLPPLYIAAQVLLPMLLGAGCLVVALAPGKLGLGIGVGLVSALALIGPVSFWMLALGLPMPHPVGPTPLGFWLGSLLCLDITLSWVSAPLLLMALSLRRAFPAHATPRSALMGAALGLLSGGAINLHCSNVGPWHLVAGHGVPVVLAALIGAGLIVRWTRT